MRRLPPLNAIRVFEVAARYENFARAAAELHVTHGAVSRQIALLEEWLGVLLFKRGARQALLTQEGRDLLKETSASLDRLELAVTVLRRTVQPSTLNVSATPTFSMHWLIPRLNRFTHRHPDIYIRLSSSLEPADFSRDSYDLAIRRTPTVPSQQAIPLFPAMSMPIGSPDLPGIAGITASGLSRHTLIHTATSPHSWPNLLASMGLKGLQPANALYFDQLYFGVQACINKMGIAVAPAVILVDDLLSEKLCLPFPRYRTENDTEYHAIVGAPYTPDSPVAKFLEWLHEEGQASYEAILELCG
ncbi:Glycine cleavage system transcriptional activator [Pigmentiphaga humi]|uniref:Glycine cleavage system transcriptional activator n=1 Tax=Pigmentiphaga humi TaxID=2478468 RepID=A0A3P4AXM1_9BURK|nr:LysR substrate-binding domain-containing protein [Pigmentiphaga humi]VCU68767.1 Glycine cleavage system transcriptional activator [Pigmentiphaga humi]